MNFLVLPETNSVSSLNNEEKIEVPLEKRAIIDNKNLGKSKTNPCLPLINRKEIYQRDIKLSYSICGDIYGYHLLNEESINTRPHVAEYVSRLHNVSVLQNQSLMPISKNRKPLKAMEGSWTDRSRTPQTQFKIIKSKQNVEKLEKVLVDFIEKNKILRSSSEEAKTKSKPKPKTQEAIVSHRKSNKVPPYKSNIIQEKFGYDEDNLRKNRLVLEKVMLERIAKMKFRK